MSITVEKCIEGWTNSLKQLRVKSDVVFFGDSLTYYGDFAPIFPDKVICNLGLRGDTIQGMIERVEQIKLVQPDYLFLMAGINDVVSSSKDSFERRYSELLRILRSDISKSKLFVQSMLPVNNERFSVSCNNAEISECNRIIRRLATGYGLPFIDLFAEYTYGGQLKSEQTIDGIHLCSTSYSKWYNIVKNIVE